VKLQYWLQKKGEISATEKEKICNDLKQTIFRRQSGNDNGSKTK
jgi:hypothetical protein